MNGGLARRLGAGRLGARATEQAAFLWHDLRQSVAVILVTASVAEEDASATPEVRRLLRHIAEEARRISRICEHSARSKGAPPVLRSLDEVVLGVIDSIRVVVHTRIEYRPSREDRQVDGVAVERALANVIENACRAAGVDGRVRIAIDDAADGSSIITVDDDGPGFGAAQEGRAGLGLEGARRVLDPLGGRLGVSNHGQLGGAHVQLHLPSSSVQPTSGGEA